MIFVSPLAQDSHYRKPMCRMWSDVSQDELLKEAKRLGCAMDDHRLLTGFVKLDRTKRDRAIAAGAKEATDAELIEHVKRRVAETA